eukprot:TRINITY_DN5350_c0_g1_i1.p1 TRINITY_DN5350_c0_g1~~TRINITY_DN5350_c0_g1_i1.p1  ORF type:complete len:712 (-),score=166.83 TRINITY_DN5350_c0_g1_i1:31-2166(-)
MAAFEALGVMPEIVKALEHELNWDLPRDIQEEAIPLILGGGDVMAAAETGSGKTGAFALPLIQVVYETLRDLATGKEIATTIKPMMSLDDREQALAVNNDGTVCQSRLESKWAGGRANIGVIRGRYYYEVSCKDKGLSRIGWSLASATFNLGTDNKGYGFGGTGKKSFSSQFDSYGQAFGEGDILGCFLDCEAGTIHWSVNGKEFPTAFKIQNLGSAWYPALVLKNAEVEVNFGSKPFKYTPSNGYIGIADADPNNTTLRGLGKLEQGRLPLAIIIEPSRELAEQTHESIKSFLKYVPPPHVTASLFTGGMDNSDTLKTIRNGVDIITGTIGRIESLVQSGQLSMNNIRFFVLDEADKLMEPDNFNSILKLYKQIPKTDKPLQTLMFSATLHSPEIKTMSEQICKFPQLVDLKGKVSVPTTVDHAVYIVDSSKDNEWTKIRGGIETDAIHKKDKSHTTNYSKLQLSEGIKVIKGDIIKRIIEVHHMDQALIFVRTRLDADNLHKYFKSLEIKNGNLGTFSSACLHSGRSQDQRRSNLEDFKKGEIRFLIATDVAARGIDIEGLPYVINYTLPAKAEDYIHRIGRTGRANKMGLAISLVGAHEEKVWYHQCRSKGADCYDTRDLSEGGCSIWYNELQILQDIEALIGKPIARIHSDLSFPESIGKSYGSKEGDNEELQKHLLSLKPVVEQLTILEDNAQKSFLNLQLRFRKK